MSLIKHKRHCQDELATAVMLVGLRSGVEKRGREESRDDSCRAQKATKMACVREMKEDPIDATECIIEPEDRLSAWVLKPAPYFYYTDRSREVDDDPLMPLTALGRVPNFPAKVRMYFDDNATSILSIECDAGDGSCYDVYMDVSSIISNFSRINITLVTRHKFCFSSVVFEIGYLRQI